MCVYTCACLCMCLCVCVFGGGVGGRFENVVEIAMLISTLVILGLQKGKQGEDGIRVEDGERSNLRVVRVRIEVPSD